jgi:hypothetical protein
VQAPRSASAAPQVVDNHLLRGSVAVTVVIVELCGHGVRELRWQRVRSRVEDLQHHMLHYLCITRRCFAAEPSGSQVVVSEVGNIFMEPTLGRLNGRQDAGDQATHQAANDWPQQCHAAVAEKLQWVAWGGHLHWHAIPAPEVQDAGPGICPLTRPPYFEALQHLQQKVNEDEAIRVHQVVSPVEIGLAAVEQLLRSAENDLGVMQDLLFA